ncbi:PKD domain-containing protein, partial [Roseovarius aestuarii]|nr:PKD domain-containing protein [Roseovarius aestuarii]
DAGAAQTVASGAAVTLDGSGSSDPDTGQTLSYEWTQLPGGPRVTLTGDTTATPGFTAPVLVAGSGSETLTFQLSFGDGFATDTETVEITVEAPANTPPTADAGPDQIVGPADLGTHIIVKLDGSGSSDPDTGQTLSYEWTQLPGGPRVTLTGDTTATPGFTAPVLVAGSGSETLTFQLSFGDGFATDTETVEITVEAPANTPPTADAGPDQIVGPADIGTLITVTLNGSGSSDPDTGQILTYSWRLVSSSGYRPRISNANTATPSLLAPFSVPGDLDIPMTLELTVSDGIATDTDTVEILVRAPVNTLPTADAGADQTVDSGAVVTLDGSGSSDPDWGQTLTYEWTQTDGTTVTLINDRKAKPRFTAPRLVAGSGTKSLIFKLEVDDGAATTPSTVIISDTVTVFVTAPPNTAPTADAGAAQTVASGAAVTLDGSGSSDPDAGQTLSYTWTQTGGTVVTLSDVNADKPGFTAPTRVAGSGPETLTFQLSFGDGIATDTDTVEITVNAPANTAPTAEAGPAQTVNSGAAVTLDGTGSTDPDTGQTLSYTWSQTGGTVVTLSDVNADKPGFTAPTRVAGSGPETLTFQLSFGDGIATDT